MSSTRTLTEDQLTSSDNSKTWSMPAATDTLVGRASTDTLTNKTISGASNTVNNLSGSNISTGTVGVGVGGTGQTSYTDGQLLIGNSSGNTLTKASLTAGANITITPGNGSITIASASFASPQFNFTSQSSTYSASVNDYILASGSSFTITLPTAVSQSGKGIVIQHNGTNLTQVYTLNTTSGQTVGGVTSGNYALYTNGETLSLVSDGSNWQIISHKTDTDWISAGNIVNYITYTISTGSATIAATYTQTYVFTITAGNTASVGAVYSNNGHNYTLVQALLVGDTTLVTTGPADPTSSGTLTYVSGTHTGGNISFSAFSGTNNSVVYTVAKTVASGTTLITQGSATPVSSGKLTKTAGTGDAIITYSSFSGSASTIGATTTPPVYYGTPITNSLQWRRNGKFMTYWMNFYQDTAGPVVGSGDYLFPLIPGATFDPTNAPVYTAGTPQSSTEFVESPVSNPFKLPGWGQADTASGYIHFYACIPYTTTSFRAVGIYNVGTGIGVSEGSSFLGANTIMGFNFQTTIPISGWQP